MRTIHCYNQYHLGDCIQSLHFLTNASTHNEVNFKLYCNHLYHEQLNELLEGFDGVELEHIYMAETISDPCFNIWIGAHDYGAICDTSNDIYGKKSDQGTYFLVLNKILSDVMGINCPFEEKKDMVYNQDSLSLDCKHTDEYDYLFVNSKNCSIEFPDFENECSDTLKKLLDNNRKVITTRKVEDVPCTIDYGMGVVEIARLAKNVKNIIAVNTGPLHLCMNKWVIPRINKFITWCPTPENFNYGDNFIPVKSLKEIEV
jgi:hypothetical protein